MSDPSVDSLIGKRAQVRLFVAKGDTALEMGSGDVPVLATPRIVALCEQATCLAITGVLPDELTTVGVEVSIRHRRASWPGEAVDAQAEVVSADPRRIEFLVQVHRVCNPDSSMTGEDAAAIILATGTITRAIVRRDAFDRPEPR